jgi:hypothetical protein
VIRGEVEVVQVDPDDHIPPGLDFRRACSDVVDHHVLLVLRDDFDDFLAIRSTRFTTCVSVPSMISPRFSMMQHQGSCEGAL